jgi:hypothetical protein
MVEEVDSSLTMFQVLASSALLLIKAISGDFGL